MLLRRHRKEVKKVVPKVTEEKETVKEVKSTKKVTK